LIVAHAIRLPCLIVHHQIRINFFHILGHETELRIAIGINIFL
jgi:hypothetical protein